MWSYTFVDAFTGAPRMEAITRLKRAIAAAGGVIVDFAFFLGAIRMSVELEASAMGRLRDALELGDVHLFEGCAASLERAAAAPRATGLVVAMLHVAFATDAELTTGVTAA